MPAFPIFGLFWFFLTTLAAIPLLGEEPVSKAAVPDASTQDAPKKVAPPIADQIKQAEVTINDLYKNELARPNKDFGQHLLKMAQETNDDLPSRYVLLRRAVEIGAVTGDSQTVYSAMDALEATFDLNTVAIWVEALDPLSKKADVSDKIAAIIDKAYQVDDYDSAAKLANLSLASARSAKNLLAIKAATAKVKEIASVQDQFKRSAAARKKLEASPTDPEANRIAGTFLCFIKKDWEKGVPMLALGDDTTLKNIAALDIEGKNGVTLGDAWNKVKGGQDRALYWYDKALPSLSGLQKARVEKLVRELSVGVPWVDLLAKVDVKRDAVAGTWKRNGNVLYSPADKGCPRIMFPTTIEGSYELIVDFSRDSGDEVCDIEIPVAERSVGIVLSTWPHLGGIGGLQNINGKSVSDNGNPTSFRPSAIQNGRRFQITIKVRLIGEDATVEAFLDSQRIVQWKGTSASLSPLIPWSMPNPKKAGFGHFDAVTLYAVRMRRL